MDQSTGVRAGHELCPVCLVPLKKHPRCALCSILIGLGHTEQRGIPIGTKVVCLDHGIDTPDVLVRAIRNDINVRKAYDEAPEMDVETEPLPRYALDAIPEWLITPKEASELTGWNPHTVRVRIARHKVDQHGWAIATAGWKAGLYDRIRVLAILERPIEEDT